MKWEVILVQHGIPMNSSLTLLNLRIVKEKKTGCDKNLQVFFQRKIGARKTPTG